MKDITVCGGGDHLVLEIVSRREYRILSDSIREDGDWLYNKTCLGLSEDNAAVVVLKEWDYVAVVEGSWHDVRFDFSNQNCLMVYGPLKQVREALEAGILVAFCGGNE